MLCAQHMACKCEVMTTFLCWLGCSHCQPSKAAHTLWAPCVMSLLFQAPKFDALYGDTPQHSEHFLLASDVHLHPGTVNPIRAHTVLVVCVCQQARM